MPRAMHSDVLQELAEAAESGDADAIEHAVMHAYQVGLRSEFVPPLLVILAQRSHVRHEDVVQALQQLKDPRAVEGLYDAALVEHEYLAYDEFFGLARKCTWALADIGTPEARARLELLAQHSNPQISAYAEKRLTNWEGERHRKGA